MPTLLEALTSRGMVHDSTPNLAGRLVTGPITGYAGFDPTADSLHVGNLVPVMALAWLQRLGGRPIILVGGGTGLVGDPSGKKSERPMLAPETVAANGEAIRKQLEQFLDFSGANAARVRDNADWLGDLGLLEFLRDTGKHFTVNYMLQKDSVDSRMESGISFAEFSYMLVQAYDFAHLAEVEQCELQLGGSDQWGNITAGIELAARRDGTKLHGLTVPLLTTAAGAKFGKSESGNVWLDPAKTSPYAFHQFWLQTEDADVARLLNFFTFLERAEIATLMEEHRADPGRRAAQRRLADDVTARVHGADAVIRATKAAAILFGTGDVRDADAATIATVAGEITVKAVARGALDGGLAIADALMTAGLAASKSEARRGLTGGGFSVNGVAADEGRIVTAEDVLAGGIVLLRKGKRNWSGLRVVDS
ncbi:MAG TPA: tyrosine--tRNA ligase [Gemmatimonadales bacterium]|jgi:tyrosyl-tRNA synthetase|nr:tyrosine--tRNA ligase [Gemmatimonadales bacterium]